MRTTIKLNKKIRKNRNHKMSRKMMAGGPSETSEEVGKKRGRDSEGAVSKKSKGIPIIVRSLGNSEPTSDSYGKRIFTQDQIKTFVDNFTDGAQTVSLPTYPQSHSILVNIEVQEDDTKKVMIVDWGGRKNWGLGKDKNKKKRNQYKKWHYYTMLLDAINEKYGPVEYYVIDKVLYLKALFKHDNNNGQGGCSEYLFSWIDKHLIPPEQKPLYQKVDTKFNP